MKKALLLLIPALFLVYANLLAQSNSALDVFGKSFVAALAQKEVAALQPLMITEVDARNTLVQTDMPTEQQDLEIENFKAALPRMQANFEGCHALCMQNWGDKGLETIEFVKIEQERESKNPHVEKTDLLIFIKINNQDYVIDVDDCVHTINGWRFTAKFGIKDLE